jgi:hypothetical protein
MKAKVETILTLALLLAFLLLPQQTFADEDVRYIYPQIETNCDQINSTAYRFQPGDTLNFTCTLTTQEEFVSVLLQKNFTRYGEFDPPYYTQTSFARFYEYVYRDGIWMGEGYDNAGDGWSRGEVGTHFYKGKHTVEIVYLFRTFGDIDGYYILNFLSEPIFKIERAEPPPTPTTLLLISGVSGAAVAFAVSAVIWHKKNSAKKEKNNVNP